MLLEHPLHLPGLLMVQELPSLLLFPPSQNQEGSFLTLHIFGHLALGSIPLFAGSP